MNRTELERLDRDALVARAEQAGVTRARILTRPELVDELLLRQTSEGPQRAQARGLFGLARDLLARVVERGLHLPDAAERIRTLGGAALPQHGAPAALPTVTLAEIYAAQGHRERAVETLEGVLEREPDHAAARALLRHLEDASYPVPAPRMPPESDEAQAAAVEANGAAESRELPAHPGDDESRSPRRDVDVCVASLVDPRTLHVSWEVRPRTLEYVRATRPEGAMTLRLAVVVPTWDGPRVRLEDHEVSDGTGEFIARDLPVGCVARAAIGWKEWKERKERKARKDGGVFLPIAHSPPP